MNIYTVGSYYDNNDGDENVVTLDSLVDKHFKVFKCLESAIAYAKSVLYERGVEDKNIKTLEKFINGRNVFYVM